MDTCRPVTTSAVRIECPYCGRLDEDDLEILDNDKLHEVRCADCEHQFNVAIMECWSCGDEHVFCWQRRLTEDQFEHLICENCKKPYFDHEAVPAFAALFA